MTTFSIQLDLDVDHDGSDEIFDAHTDAVYEALLHMDNIFDADMSASISERTVSFSVWTEAENQVAALEAAVAAIRTAIHVENGATPGWEAALERARAAVSPADAQTLVAATR